MAKTASFTEGQAVFSPAVARGHACVYVGPFVVDGRTLSHRVLIGSEEFFVGCVFLTAAEAAEHIAKTMRKYESREEPQSRPLPPKLTKPKTSGRKNSVSSTRYKSDRSHQALAM